MKHVILHLSKIDQEYLHSVLENSPEPSPALVALLSGKKLLSKIPVHKYKKEKTCGIGFCSICYSDDIHDGNHI
jgi:hypothetical protein